MIFDQTLARGNVHNDQYKDTERQEMCCHSILQFHQWESEWMRDNDDKLIIHNKRKIKFSQKIMVTNKLVVSCLMFSKKICIENPNNKITEFIDKSHLLPSTTITDVL